VKGSGNTLIHYYINFPSKLISVSTLTQNIVYLAGAEYSRRPQLRNSVQVGTLRPHIANKCIQKRSDLPHISLRLTALPIPLVECCSFYENLQCLRLVVLCDEFQLKVLRFVQLVEHIFLYYKHLHIGLNYTFRR
jgi:hypothetical protein